MHFRKSFQAALADASRESGDQDDRFNNQFDSKVNYLNVFCHNLYLEFNKTKIMINQSWNYNSLKSGRS